METTPTIPTETLESLQRVTAMLEAMAEGKMFDETGCTQADIQAALPLLTAPRDTGGGVDIVPDNRFLEKQQYAFFASHALQGLLSSPYLSNAHFAALAENAFALADTMLEGLKERDMMP